MEYCLQIGLTMAMIVVISASSSTGGTSTMKPDITNDKHHKKTTRSITSPVPSTQSASSPGGNSNASTSCRKIISKIDGTKCDGNKKCPVNDGCDDPSLCPCMDGYAPHNDTLGNRPIIICDDIQECNLGTHICGPHTECNNTIGGYFCSCEKGFRRGNETEFCPTDNRADNGCSDIDECKEDPYICGPNGTCKNTDGSYYCVCMIGFRNSTKNCTDIDECKEDPYICGPNGTCKNTYGSYYCVCMNGFRNSTNNCTEINECKENPTICDPNGDCANTIGSYTCECREGYQSVYNNCSVKCKQEDEIKPPACDSTGPQCILDTFTESWKPSCNDSNREKFDTDKLLDGLDDVISKFLNQMIEKKERLRLAGKLLNGVEGMVQNLAYYFPSPMRPSQKKNFINAVTTSRTSKYKDISLINRNSAIRLDTKTALGNVYTSVFGCLEYGNIKKLLEGAELQNENQNLTVKLVSSVVSVFLGITNTSKLSEPIQLQLNFTGEKVTSNKTHCAFWSVKDAAWSTEGCETLERHDYGVVCNCNHLTSFAVLMALDNIESWTLSLITKIGLSISIVCLSAAIITFSLCRFLRGTRNTIHIHLCVSLLLGHCIFLIGVEATSSKEVCGVVAGFLHFFYLSAFCWMSLEGLELYLMLVTVFKTQVKTRYLLAMGYGVPTVIIIISAAVFPGGYGTEKHCWLSTDHNFIWSFMGPVCVIILINCGIFVLTVWKLAEKMTAINPEQGKLKRIRSLTVTSVAQLCILGCCWAFGFLMFGKTALIFAYAFTICNVLQGVQIFILHCLMNKKVREKYAEVICALAHFRSPLYSEFSNSTNVNTHSRAKVSKESGL